MQARIFINFKTKKIEKGNEITKGEVTDFELKFSDHNT